LSAYVNIRQQKLHWGRLQRVSEPRGLSLLRAPSEEVKRLIRGKPVVVLRGVGGRVSIRAEREVEVSGVRAARRAPQEREREKETERKRDRQRDRKWRCQAREKSSAIIQKKKLKAQK
jgi:hypothetical protein